MAGAEALAAVEPYRSMVHRDPGAVAEDLESLARLLRKWNAAQNLVSRETLDQVWTRHIADSLQVLPLLRADDRLLTDLGSGGGFPALPLAIALEGGDSRLLLVEPITKKAAFLRTVIRELALPAEVRPERAEAIDSRETGLADVITSRALAPLSALLPLAAPLLRQGGRALLHKGREHVEELRESRLAWQFDVLIHPSMTDAHGVLLEISNLRSKTS